MNDHTYDPPETPIEDGTLLASKRQIDLLTHYVEVEERNLGLDPLPRPAFHTDPLLSTRLSRVLHAYKERLREARSDRDDAASTLKGEIDLIDAALRDLERSARSGRGGSPAERIRGLVAEHDRIARTTIEAAVRFRDDLIVQFRALALCAEMVGSAGTHREKDARLRGMFDLIEGAVARLRDARFDHPWDARFWPDVMRSDWPYRRLREEQHQLAADLAEAKREIARLKGEPVPGDESDGDDLPPLSF